MLKGIRRTLALSFATGLTLVPQIALAEDPFAQATSKVSDINTGLVGNLAVAVVTLAIIVAGFLTLTGRINMKTGVSIIAGAIILGSASTLASWIMQK